MKLRADLLIKRYKSRTVVNQVSVEVEQGEIVGLLGPNGAGKTTTFYMIVGLIKPNEGTIHLDDVDITGLPMYKRAQQGVGYLPQEASIFRKLSVEDNLKAVLEMRKALSKQDQHKRLEALLDEFGLQHVRKNRGDLLSGGERRRTEIARALASDPKFILLDEPFAGVDPIAVEDIQSIVATLKDKNIGILITDHNVQETLSITDRAYLLFEGSILKAGTAEELASDPQVRKVYLGQNFELKKGRNNNSTEAFLRSLSVVELGFFHHHQWPKSTPQTKEFFSAHLKRNHLTIDFLKEVFEEEKVKVEEKEDCCPRCGSDKLLTTKEAKIVTDKFEGLDALTDQGPTVEKVSCNVCGFIISDPNKQAF
jgi:lipopolysaccharide export system ATP-binding protein